jgi:CubicO group peptidase (beta-lactamase class C family)
VPEHWLRYSTSASAGSDGYGYLWWLEGDGNYRASGIYGQGIYIAPADNLVIAVLSAWPVATGSEYSRHRDSFFDTVNAMLAP